MFSTLKNKEWFIKRNPLNSTNSKVRAFLYEAFTTSMGLGKPSPVYKDAGWYQE